MEYVIHHIAEAERFEIHEAGHTAYLSYRRGIAIIHITSTYVPSAIGGKGIAAALVKESIKYARDNNLKIDPICSYVKVYFERNPQEKDLLV